MKIDTIGLAKLNNAEYTNFMNRTLNQAVAVGIEKIGASDTLIDGITANVNLALENIRDKHCTIPANAPLLRSSISRQITKYSAITKS